MSASPYFLSRTNCKNSQFRFLAPRISSLSASILILIQINIFISELEIICIMENHQIRKKVYLRTQLSTEILPQASQLPQWTSDNIFNYASSFQFISYNIQEELLQIIPRNTHESEVILQHFKGEINQNLCQAWYVVKQDTGYYLQRKPEENKQKILIYKIFKQNRTKVVNDILNFLISEGQQSQSTEKLITTTKKLIEQFDQDKQQHVDYNEEIFHLEQIKQMLFVQNSGFALFLVKINGRSGIMLMNINKSSKQKIQQFTCPIIIKTLSAQQLQIPQKHAFSPRIVYLFSDDILSIHSTQNITRFIILTTQKIILIKINFNLMELKIQHKLIYTFKTNFKPISSLSIANIEGCQYIIALLQEKSSELRSTKKSVNKHRQYMKIYLIDEEKIIQNTCQHEKYKNKCIHSHFNSQTQQIQVANEKTIKKTGVKFNDRIIQNEYDEIEAGQVSIGKQLDLHHNVFVDVFQNIITKQQTQNQMLIKSKQISRKTLTFPSQIQITPNNEDKQKIINEIGGFVVNKNTIIIWEKQASVLHQCILVNSVDFQNDQSELTENSKKGKYRLSAQQNQMKDIYSKLMGLKIQELHPLAKPTHYIQYKKKIQLILPYNRIHAVILSPKNYNLLIITKGANRTSFQFNIFQYDLYSQLETSDPNVFLKPFKNLFRRKPIEQISRSRVKDQALIMSGNQIHTLTNELLEGAISFDIHPYNIYLAVSFGVTAKIYALQANDKLTSLYTLNGQGMKKIRYNPMGHQFFILFSKFIKIIDSYNFSVKYILHERNSNFLEIQYASQGHELYTISQNHTINVYQTFNYTKIDQIKPAITITDFKPILIKSYSKYNQYCIVLQNGTLFVKYKSDAVVIRFEEVFSYSDEQKIQTIQIDEKNGILFIGCKSGKLRSHIWPIRQQIYNFDTYSEVRTGYYSISCLSISSISPSIYAGNLQGNVSVYKYFVDRQKKIQNQNDKGLMFTQKNIKYLNMTNLSNIAKVYKYVLGSSTLLTEQMPQKIKLQYKLSEVIQKLNEQMKKMKTQIKEQLEEKYKKSIEKFDVNLFFHINKMITNKLLNQLYDQQIFHQKQIKQIKQAQQDQLKNILAKEIQLSQLKSLSICDLVTRREKERDNFNRIAKNYTIQWTQKENEIKKNVQYIQKIKNEKEEDIYFLPNENIKLFEIYKQELDRQLELQHKKSFDLRKQCTYKETQIQDILARKVKEETLQFKVNLEIEEMKSKLSQNKDNLDEIKSQVTQAQMKLHKVQMQASIFKNNAQFKRIASLDTMNDACSYKLWVKNKFEQEIASLSGYLKSLEELLQEKSNEIVEIISNKAKKVQKISILDNKKMKNKEKLSKTKLNLMDSINKLKANKNIELSSQKSELMTSTARGSFPSKINRGSTSRISKQKQFRQKTRGSDRNDHAFNNIMDKQINFLKTNIKIHHRKINKFGKQNGQLLSQYQKLKFQNRSYLDKYKITKKELLKVDNELNHDGKQFQIDLKDQVQVYKTSFQKYLENKTLKIKEPKYKTATTSPTYRISPRKIYD